MTLACILLEGIALGSNMDDTGLFPVESSFFIVRLSVDPLLTWSCIGRDGCFLAPLYLALGKCVCCVISLVLSWLVLYI